MKMSSKLQLLLTQMRNNSDEIDDIHTSSDEFYFKYRSRQFSIQFRTGNSEFYFFVYPKWTGGSTELAELYETADAEHVLCVSYHGSELEDPSVLELLYTAIREKALGLDDLFDDVLD